MVDVNNDGKIDYREFCNLVVEEKRRGIDPFESEHKNRIITRRNAENSIILDGDMVPNVPHRHHRDVDHLENYQPHIIDHEEGPVDGL